jgi:uncharacterized protein
MGRIVFFLLLAMVAYIAWRFVQKRGRDRGAGGQEQQQVPQTMVSCATCGLHLPRQEALPLGDRYFCCEEHRRHPPTA